jgi:glutaredoxin
MLLDLATLRKGGFARMLDTLRTSLDRLLTSRTGDSFAPVRVPRDLARRMNVALGKPVCSSEELEKRRSALVRLATLRSAKVAAPVVYEQAPVMVYFEKNKSQKTVERVEELLTSKGIAFKKLDVAGDEATMQFVCRAASCEDDDLPVVFIAGDVVGTYAKLVEWDVSGKLARAVNPVAAS